MARAKEFTIDESWRLVIGGLGIRPADVFRRAQLPEDLLTRPEARLNSDEYFRFWSSLEVEASDPMFPIRIAELLTAESFVPPIFAARCSPNFSVALSRFAHYKRLVAPMNIDKTENRNSVSASFRWTDATTIPPQSLCAGEIALLVTLIRTATRERIVPIKVTAPSPPVPVGAYKRFFGVAIHKGRQLSVTFSRADAERPFLSANESMWEVFEPELRRRLSELDDTATIGQRVRSVLLESLPSGQGSMTTVASRLAVSTRTLQRRLNEEGTSFKALVNRTREELARHYLLTTTLSCTEISFLLGYEDPNSFFRAFHEWTGETPESMRQPRAH
ncbi:MAG: AraC family transcriptional regulator ligand-binding domain-containing protein [Myxococcota bacterium]